MTEKNADEERIKKRLEQAQAHQKSLRKPGFQPYKVWRGHPHRRRHKAEPTITGTLLATALDKRGLTDMARLARITTLWRTAVGERIADAATPDGYNRGVLSLRARTAAWQQELSYLREDLLRRLNETLESDFDQNKPRHKSGGRPDKVTDLKIRAGVAQKKKPEPKAVPAPQQARIVRIAEDLPEGEIRDAFIQLMRRSYE